MAVVSPARSRPHYYVFSRGLGWGYCAYCGLVPLNNAASRKAWEKACPGSEPDDEVKIKVVRKK